jgi:hypothetical protein
LQVRLYDAFGNAATVNAGGLSVVLTQRSATFAADVVVAGTQIVAAATIAIAGATTSVVARLNGVPLGLGCCFNLLTTIGAPSAGATVLTGTGVGGLGSAGEIFSVAASPFDAAGNLIELPEGLSVTLAFEPDTGVCSPCSSALAGEGGLYTVAYSTNVAGSYTVTVTVADASGGTSVQRYPLVVEAGELDIGNTGVSQASGADGPLAAGTTGSFGIQLQDVFGNPVTDSALVTVHVFLSLVSLSQAGSGTVLGVVGGGALTLPTVPAVRHLLELAGGEEGVDNATSSGWARVSSRSLLQATASPEAGTPAVVLSTKNSMIISQGFTDAGLYRATYTATRAGTYQLEIEVNGVMLDMQTPPLSAVASIGISAGPAFSATSSLRGTGLTFGVVGAPVESFQVTPKDRFSNLRFQGDVAADTLSVQLAQGATPFTVSQQNVNATAPYSATIKTFVVTSISQAAYPITYLTNVAGDVVGTVRIGGVGLIGGNPFTATIIASGVDAATSEITGAGLLGTVSQVTTVFTIISKDAFGNSLAYGGAAFTTSFVSLPGGAAQSTISSPRDDLDGTYLVTYRVLPAGFVGDVTIRVRLGGVHLTGSPKVVPVVGGGRTMDPSRVSADGDGLSGGGAGVPLSFTIFANDRNGIQLTDQDSLPAAGNFAVSLIGPGSSTATTPAIVTAGSIPGTYVATYTLDSQGTYAMQIQAQAFVGGGYSGAMTTVSGGESAVVIRPGPTNADASYVSLNDPTVVASGLPAGSELLLKLTSRDEFENRQVYDSAYRSDRFVVVAELIREGATTLTFVLSQTDAEAVLGEYTAAATPTVAGTWTVRTSLGGVTVPFTSASGPDGTVSLEVLAGPLDTGNTYTTGAGLSGGDVGETLRFRIYPVDAYDNVVPVSPTACVVTLVPVSGSGTAVEPITAGSLADVDQGSRCFPDPACAGTAGCPLKVEYKVQSSGQYELLTQLNGVNVAGSPRSVSVLAGEVSATSSIVPLSAASDLSTQAGVAGSFVFQSRDAEGNALTSGGASIEVYGLVEGGTPPGVPGIIEDNGDGTYTISFLPLVGGVYSVSVKLGGENAGGSPIRDVMVADPPVSHALSYTYGAGRTRAVADEETYFYIQTINIFGAEQSVPSLDKLSAQVIPPDGLKLTTYYRAVAPPVITVESDAGVYKVAYTAYITGFRPRGANNDYTVRVQLDVATVVAEVSGSPSALQLFNGAVAAGETSVAPSRASDGSLAFRGTVGEINRFVIVPRDAYGNNVTYDQFNLVNFAVLVQNITGSRNLIPECVVSAGLVLTRNGSGARRVGERVLERAAHGVAPPSRNAGFFRGSFAEKWS